MQRSRVLYTLLLSLSLLFIRAPAGGGQNAVDIVVDNTAPAEKKLFIGAQVRDKTKSAKKPESTDSERKPADLGDGSTGTVIINGITVPKDKITSLEHTYGVPIQPGRYWYDKISGLWGVEGSPLMGQIVPDLDLGGPLKVKASNGTTGVFINGRELPMQEVIFLQQLGPVSPGRYWLDARGIGGFEGGPPQFDLGAAIAAQDKKKGGGMYGGWNRTTPGGHLGGDDNCSYFFDPNSGSSVMNCK